MRKCTFEWWISVNIHLNFDQLLNDALFFECVSMDVVAMATVNGKGNYSQRQNPHTSGRIQRPWKIMFVCIRSSIIQCVQLKSHAIYLIFRYFAQITMNTNRVRAHFVFQYARSVFFLSISCSDLIICDYTKTIHKYTYTKVQKVDALHPYFARFLTRPTFFLCCKCVYYSILYIFISIHFCAILTQYLSNYSGARTCAWLLLLHFFLPPFHCDSSKVEAKCSVNLELFSLCVILVKPQH